MARIKLLAKPIRKPVQARSAHTVDAIFEATIQVLIQLGINQLTTTKVADRAGVSVGTLYQYFPNKTALLSAALERHLNAVVTAIENECDETKGQPIRVMATSLVNAFVKAKLSSPDASKALYVVASEHGGADVVARMTQRSQLALCDMLSTAADVTFSDLRVVSYMLSTALVGPVQGLLHTAVPPAFVQLVKEQLVLMTVSYLMNAGARRRS
jgi:AcrR family transcriptional regulator